jgi:integrase
VGAKPGRKTPWCSPARTARCSTPSGVTKEFRRLAKAARLPLIRPHDLRHSYANSALAAGVPIEVLSKRLGHSRISITEDVYVHTNERQDRDAANLAASTILGG